MKPSLFKRPEPPPLRRPKHLRTFIPPVWWAEVLRLVRTFHPS